MSKDGDGGGDQAVVWSVALRGAVVGLVTVILAGLFLMVPSQLPDRPEEFGNLGRYVMFLYATPVVILAAGWIGGWIARLRRPWAMAIAAPVVAWVLIFASVGFASQWTVPVIVAAVALVLVSYAATAVLAAPLPVRHLGWIRAGAVLLVVVVFFAGTALHAVVSGR
ncbi:MAG TPA: hypothetical protein VFC19_30655 [Candidatus Limnocylindrales bacterium]|nr:hypothetical protein [Candidatus Limnocylindrales bacterium]